MIIGEIRGFIKAGWFDENQEYLYGNIVKIIAVRALVSHGSFQRKWRLGLILQRRE